MAQQDAIITQTITGTAEATSDQTSTIDQASVEPPDTDTASADDDEPRTGTGTGTGAEAARRGQP